MNYPMDSVSSGSTPRCSPGGLGAAHSPVLFPEEAEKIPEAHGPGKQQSSLASLECVQLAWWRLSNPDDTSLCDILVGSSCYRADFSSARGEVRMRVSSSYSWSGQSIPLTSLPVCSTALDLRC